MNNSLLERIISEISNKNYRSAITGCNELIGSYPGNHRIYELRALCFYALGEYDSAESDLTFLVEQYKESNDDPALLMSLYNRRGKNFMKKRDWSNAIDDFINAININDAVPEIHNNLAICYRRVESFEDAYLHASKAIELKNDFAEAYNNRANINICLSNADDAITDYSNSIKLNPGNPKTYFNRGSIYYEVFKDYENAREDFLSAIRLNPDYEEEIIREYPEFKDLLFESDNEESSQEDSDGFKENFTEEDNKTEESTVADNISELKTSHDTDNETDEQAENENSDDTVTPPNDEEIIVPQFNLKGILGGEEVDDSHIVEEMNQSEIQPVLSEDAKILHEEIVSETEVKEQETVIASEPEKEAVPKEIRMPHPYVPTSRIKTEKSFLSSPVFFVSVIILIVGIISFVVIKLYLDRNKQSTVENVVTEPVKNEPSLVVDTQNSVVKTEDTNVSNPVEVKKEEPVTEESKQPVLESRNLGYIGNKQSLVLFSEPDGYYVQIGSFKERNKAEEKLNMLKKKNVKGVIAEADLKEKGIFYRVRAGAFKSEEEARQVTLKLE